MQETLQRTPEQQNPAAAPEVEGPEKQVAFLDGNGIERAPHPDAIECYASPEIIEEVTSHFEGVDRGIEEIEEILDDIESGQDKLEKPFNPLSEELLRRIKEKAKSQLPGLTVKREKYVREEVTTGRVFKKTKTVPKKVEVDEPVQGFTATTEGHDQQRSWKEVSYKADHKGEYINLDDKDALETLETYVADKLEDLLTSDERTPYEPHGTKLPLLAKKIKDAKLSEEEIDGLSWHDLEQLVPEAAEWLSDARVLEESLKTRQLIKERGRLEDKLSRLSPVGCSTIARIYYSEELLERLNGLKLRLDDVYNILAPQLGYQEYHPEDTYMADQRKAIESFFDYASNANQILMHGTKSIPRIIKSGALKPAANMEDGDFTFNTNRTNVRGATATSDINGSRAVHWAGPAGISYASNIKVTEAMVREDLARRLRVSTDHPFVEEEIAKGGFGEALMVMRLGDIIQHTPYGGYAEVSLGNEHRQVKAMPRYGLVELTPKGWEKVKEKEPAEGPMDAAYIAAPHNPGVEGIYDYEYPLDKLLIGVPEADPEQIPELLREQGWSEAMIESHTFRYSGDKSDRVGLQTKLHRNPKYPRTLIVPIAMETGLD